MGISDTIGIIIFIASVTHAVGVVIQLVRVVIFRAVIPRADIVTIKIGHVVIHP